MSFSIRSYSEVSKRHRDSSPQAVREVSNVLFDLAERVSKFSRLCILFSDTPLQLKTQWEDAIDSSDSTSTTVNVITLIHQATYAALTVSYCFRMRLILTT